MNVGVNLTLEYDTSLTCGLGLQEKHYTQHSEMSE